MSLAEPLWNVEWELAEDFPYKSLPDESIGRLECAIGEQDGWEDLDSLLGWAGGLPAPGRTARQIGFEHAPAVPASIIEKKLSLHDAFVIAEPSSDDFPVLFIPTRTLVERIVRIALQEISADQLGGRFLHLLDYRLTGRHYRICRKTVQSVLENTGLAECVPAEESSEVECLFVHIRSLTKWLKHFDLHGRVELSWRTFPIPTAKINIEAPWGLPKERTNQFWEIFNESERDLLLRRLIDGQTLREVGQSRSITRSRTSQIEKKAFEKLDQPGVFRLLGLNFVQSSLDLSSFRLVEPSELGSRLSEFWGRNVTAEALERLLLRWYRLEINKLYDGTIWHIYPRGEKELDLPDVSGWKYELEVPFDGFAQAVQQGLPERAHAQELRMLHASAEKVHRNSITLDRIIVNALRSLGKPSSVHAITDEIRRISPNFSSVTVPQVRYEIKKVESKYMYRIRHNTYILPDWDVESESKIMSPVKIGQTSVDKDSNTVPVVKATEGDSLFAHIDPQGKIDSIQQAGGRIVARLGELPSSQKKSLCELKIEEEDYKWLCEWATQVSPDDLKRVFQTKARINTIEKIGCLLLLLTVEVARREAREGEVWSVVAAHFNAEARRFLFNGTYPTSHFIEAIETAFRSFDLRHVLGMEGTHSYYLSVYLQFGFTKRGVPRLPFWLIGHGHPIAVQYLLASPDLCSASFQMLWQGLKEFRRGNIPEEQIRSILENSPWAPPSSIDELIQQACERRELDQREEESGELEKIPINFLGEVSLHWDYPSSPRFFASLINLAVLDLEAPKYDVFVGDQIVASLISQSDAGYVYPDQIELPTDSPSLVAALVDDHGDTQIVQEISLWDSHEDLGVALFDGNTGRRLDAWSGKMNHNRPFILMVERDLQVSPEIRFWQHLNEARSLYQLNASWDRDLRVLLDGEELWKPHITRKIDQQDPEWARRIRVICLSYSTIQLGDHVSIEVKLLEDQIRVDSIRIAGTPLLFEQENGVARTTPFGITPAVALSAQKGLKVQVKVRKGTESFLLIRKITLDICGVVCSNSKGSWEKADPAAELTVREAQRRLYHFFLSAEQIQDMGVFESDFFLQKLKSRMVPFDQLLGMGGPLIIHKVYNRLPDDDIIRIAKEVVNRGVVQYIEKDKEGVTIYLGNPIGLSERHQIVYWDAEADWDIVDGKEIQIRSKDSWWTSCQHPVSDQSVVGIAYDGERIGAWWGEEIDPFLQGLDYESAKTAAALIRWMHLPIQKRDWRGKLTDFVHMFPAEAASAWLLGSGLPESLQHISGGAEWVVATRTFFEDCDLNVEQLERFHIHFVEEDSSTPLADIIRQLSLLDPLFMGRLVQVYLQQEKKINTGFAKLEDQVHLARNDFLGLSMEAGNWEVKDREKQLLEEAAKSMCLDSHFLDHVVQHALKRLDGEDLSPLEFANLTTALGVQPFRRYLSVKVLDRVASLA